MTAVALGALTIALPGCGLGAGSTPKSVSLTVTRDFGAHTVHESKAPEVKGQETVMSLLTRNASVSTRYGGGFVQSIDGLSGGDAHGEPVDWFYYVNGVQAPQGAAATNVSPGDHIWWDLHDWSQTENVPAVVGSFPEPFVNGVGGKRWPVRVECAEISSEPCQTVGRRLRALGVLAPFAGIGPGAEPETLRVLVGGWRSVSGQVGVRAIESGPRASGVYARLSAGEMKLTLLDESGSVVRTLGAGAGLIAAVRPREEAPVWVITGTSDAGVTRAARAFDQADLHDRFALAIAPDGARLPVPAPIAAKGRSR
jgi:Domain of unknown function (DUF4430)